MRTSALYKARKSKSWPASGASTLIYMQNVPAQILVLKLRTPYQSLAYSNKNRQSYKIKQNEDDRIWHKISYSPSARPLIERVSRHLGHPYTPQAIIVLLPGVALTLVGADPVPGFVVLGIGYVSREDRDQWLSREVRHGVAGEGGGECWGECRDGVDRRKCSEQVG